MREGRRWVVGSQRAGVRGRPGFAALEVRSRDRACVRAAALRRRRGAQPVARRTVVVFVPVGAGPHVR